MSCTRKLPRRIGEAEMSGDVGNSACPSRSCGRSYDGWLQQVSLRLRPWRKARPSTELRYDRPPGNYRSACEEHVGALGQHDSNRLLVTPIPLASSSKNMAHHYLGPNCSLRGAVRMTSLPIHLANRPAKAGMRRNAAMFGFMICWSCLGTKPPPLPQLVHALVPGYEEDTQRYVSQDI